MRVALVCDDLIQNGGHEKVILDFCAIFPDAPLYTTVATEDWQTKCASLNIALKTSFMQRLPFVKKLNRLYAPFMLYIFALQKFDFSKYDLVISLSSRFAHGIITKPQTMHICYMSTPGRMFWEPASYFRNESFGGIAVLKFFAILLLAIPLHLIRIWDYTKAQRVDLFISNSNTTRRRIKKYYRRAAELIYPAIDVKKFVSVKALDILNDPYFLVITRLVSWKKVDIAIDAAVNYGFKLKIIGIGPDLNRLQDLAHGNSNIEFLGYVSEKRKIEELQNCVALINTQLEDFGLTALEAMACGKPVIAYGSGGALETVVSGKTGEFFNEQTSDMLGKAVKNFDPTKYNREECLRQAQKFDISIFYEKIKLYCASRHG